MYLPNHSMKAISNELLKRMMAALERPVQYIIEGAKKDKATKDGYGTVLQFISGHEPHQQALILLALRSHGYPHDTLESIVSLGGTKTEELYHYFDRLLSSLLPTL